MNLKEEIDKAIKKANDEKQAEYELLLASEAARFAKEQKQIQSVLTRIPESTYQAVKNMDRYIHVHEVPKSEYDRTISGRSDVFDGMSTMLKKAYFSYKVWERLEKEGLKPELVYTETPNNEDTMNHYLEVRCYIALKNPNYRAYYS